MNPEITPFSTVNNTRYLVVKGSGGGGLGDAIRSIIVAALYADISNRTLYIDWRHGLFGDSGDNIFNKLFSLCGLSTTSFQPSHGTVFPPTWCNRLSKSFDSVYREDRVTSWNRHDAIRKYSFDLSRIDYSHDILVMWDFDQLQSLVSYLPDDWRDCSYIEIMGKAYHRYFFIQTSISKLVSEFWEKHGRQTMIGIHLRMTNEFSTNKGGIRLKNYFNVLDKKLKEFPDAGIYVATDNIDCLKIIQKKYTRTITWNKWFSKPGDSLHLNDNCPDKLQASIDALCEIICLSKCDHIICPGSSSFSMVARIMAQSHAVSETLIYPTNGKVKKLFDRLGNIITWVSRSRYYKSI